MYLDLKYIKGTLKQKIHLQNFCVFSFSENFSKENDSDTSDKDIDDEFLSDSVFDSNELI
jgi:hypothetical protein